MRVSSNSDVCKIVQSSLSYYSWLTLERGSKHWRMRNLRSQDFLPIPFSPSDTRVSKHLRAQIRRLAEDGLGLIAAKKCY